MSYIHPFAIIVCCTFLGVMCTFYWVPGLWQKNLKTNLSFHHPCWYFPIPADMRMMGFCLLCCAEGYWRLPSTDMLSAYWHRSNCKKRLSWKKPKLGFTYKQQSCLVLYESFLNTCLEEIYFLNNYNFRLLHGLFSSSCRGLVAFGHLGGPFWPSTLGWVSPEVSKNIWYIGFQV